MAVNVPSDSEPRRRRRRTPEVAEQEIIAAIEEGTKEGVVDEDERQMIESVITFHNTQVGQIMTAAAFLAKTPHPTDDQITQAMAGNICRCGTYDRIRKAIHRAAGGGQ